jgi:hypothetical protein
MSQKIQNTAQSEGEITERFSVFGEDRIVPGLTFEQVLLTQLYRCEKAYSSQSVDFPHCVEALNLLNIPRLTEKERKNLREEIKKIKEEKEAEYKIYIEEKFKGGNFTNEELEDGLYQQARRRTIERDYNLSMNWEIARLKYELILSLGKLDKTFRLSTEKDRT